MRRRSVLRHRSAAFIASAALAAPVLLGCSGDPDMPPGGPAPAAACGEYGLNSAGAGSGARVFAVQPKIALENMASYEAFRDHLVGLVEARVTPCLAGDRLNLIVFPEDVGLPASFLGSRGAKARTAGYATEAFFYLSERYSGPMSHYKAKWPDIELAESLGLALTDTVWRAFYEAMRDIAKGTGAHVIASANVSGAIEASDDPAEIEALGDPDLAGSAYVYVARDKAIYNTAFVFAPTGEVIAQARKPYLVESEEKDLRLTYGALRDVAPIDIGSLRLGVLTSKDAWMPDVVGRLSALGASVFVQPEAFSGWTIEEVAGDWLPDVVQQSGWAATQKHSGYRYAVIPHLTGNLFDQVFDGQSAIIEDSTAGEAALAYVGQEPQGGFLAVAPWAVEDPGVGDPGLSIEERRAVLRARGEARKPGGAEENAYIETVVAADIDPAAPFSAAPDGDAGALGKSAEIAPSAAGEQTSPALASGGSIGGARTLCAWQDDRDGRPQIYLARSTDAGETFGEASPVAPSAGAQITPAVLAVGDYVYAAWQERASGEARVAVALSKDAGQSFGAPVYPGAQSGGGAGGADEWRPSLAADGAAVYLAYAAGVGGNERVQVGRAAAGEMDWQVVPGDGDPSAFDGLNIRNNQWAPSIAAQNGEVAVAWVDFRSYNWDVLLSRSTDGGQTFGAAVRIDDGGDAPERIHDDPALLFGPGGALLCGWSDVRLRRMPAKARVARADGGAFGAGEVLGQAPLAANAWRPRMVSVGASTIAAVFQDHRSLRNAIYLVSSGDGGATFGPERRVDDAGQDPARRSRRRSRPQRRKRSPSPGRTRDRAAAGSASRPDRSSTAYRNSGASGPYAVDGR